MPGCPAFTFPVIAQGKNPGVVSVVRLPQLNENIRIVVISFATDAKAQAAVTNLADALEGTNYRCTDHQRNLNTITAGVAPVVTLNGRHGLRVTSRVAVGAGSHPLHENNDYFVLGRIVISVATTNCDNGGVCSPSLTPDPVSADVFAELVANNADALGK
jgi:hypothetical protein